MYDKHAAFIEALSFNNPVLDCSADTLSHQVLTVVLGLDCRVYSSEPVLECLPGTPSPPIFLPCRAVDEPA